MRQGTILLLCLGSLAVSGCVSSTIPRKETPAINALQPVTTAVRFRKEYVLAIGDQVEVSVRPVSDLSRTVVVRPDGYISLPLIKEVMAAGLTVPELDSKITELYSGRLNKPEVTVIATSVRQPVVYVLGDVNNNAAAVPLRDAPTAMQAIALAGGFKRTAAARDVTLIRLSDDGYLHAIPVAKPPLHGQPAPYVALRSATLQPDDIVFVPENGRSQIARFLDDFVNRPLAGLNAIAGTYVNFRLIRLLDR